MATETWFSPDTCMNTPGYSDYHVYREGGGGGGVSVFVRSGFVSSSVPALSFISNVVEMNTVQLNLNPRLTVQIIAVYRPHHDKHMFNNQISNAIAFTPRSTLSYIVGI